MKIITQEIFDPRFKQKKIRVFMRRLDLISSKISGNKFFSAKVALLNLNSAFCDLSNPNPSYSIELSSLSIIAAHCTEGKYDFPSDSP